MSKTLPEWMRSFGRAEDGAVTVDWVVLTAAVVSLGMLAGVAIWGKTGGAAKGIADYIGTQGVDTTPM
ncbi:hypothetical protein FGG78_01385 [Thioclava sp. BHET1]|uniref:hypothetical protein n=1 Tax=Thioclava dalianensis TaxID=1185766 RepID=UPI00056DED94|nr:hypothetical protein [Thioclava dalianensis]TMV94806.1 hypothetical protein FGG78_01385 [Thioclava sp. BHET1]SFM89757.1 hypothetical protein SAMN05216224_101796 [Thioclava dalianensis]